MGSYGEFMGFHITSRKIKFYFQICLKSATYFTVIVIGSTTVLWFFSYRFTSCGRLLPHPLFDPSTFSGLADLHFIGRREVRWDGGFFWVFLLGRHGYGSIPVDTITIVGWTSILTQLWLGVNKRYQGFDPSPHGTYGWENGWEISIEKY